MAEKRETKHVMDVKIELIEGQLVSTTVFADPDFRFKACCSCSCCCVEIDDGGKTTTKKPQR
jgi:hypothetical protein